MLEAYEERAGQAEQAGLLSFRAVPYVPEESAEPGAAAGAPPPQELALVYNLDLGAGFLSSLTLLDAATGAVQRQVVLAAQHAPTSALAAAGAGSGGGGGFSGETYFIRASDLLDKYFLQGAAPPPPGTGHAISSDSTVEEEPEELVVGQHRSGASWNLLAYAVDARASCGTGDMARVTLVGQGNTGATTTDISGGGGGGGGALESTTESCSTLCAHTGSLSAPLDTAYDYSASLVGLQTEARLRVAGGILYTYTV